MCKRVITLLLMAAFLGSGVFAQVPRLLFEDARQKGTHPLWVSADEAVDGSSVRWEYFAEAQQHSLEADLQRAYQEQIERERTIAERRSDSPDPGCHLFTLSSGHNIEEPTLERLFDASRIALTGIVVDGEDGFWSGEPSALYEVKVDQVFKDPLRVLDDGRILVRHSVAKVRIGDLYLCAGDPESMRPAIGKRVLILSPSVITSEPAVVVGDSYYLFFETADGRLQSPRGFTKDVDSWTDLESASAAVGSTSPHPEWLRRSVCL